MMLHVRTHRALRRRLRAFVVVALAVWLASPYADAQVLSAATPGRTTAADVGPAPQASATAPDDRGTEAGPIQRSLATLRFDVAPIDSAYRVDNAFAKTSARAEAQRGYRGRRGRGDRGTAGLVLGVIGGFVAGGAIGVAVAEHSCNCNDPALHGFIIGAPIGAVVGGFIGYAIAR